MTVAILKDDSKESINSSQTLLQFIANGVFNKPKYNFHFNMKKEIIEILLNNKYKREMFHNKLKKIISKEYYIDEEEIIITYPRKGSYIVSLIFKSIDFELNERELLRKFENYKEELGVLKKIEKTIILDGCKLTVSMLDVRGNNKDPGWAKIGEKRGGEDYIPPLGWTGFGLKVLDVEVYENNKWLKMFNEGEWPVAYHGVAHFEKPQEVLRIAGLIYKTEFKPSTWGKITDFDDIRHPGKKCGLGVYCSPDISYAEKYAGKARFNNENYKCVLMLRVNPKKIRQCKEFPKEYLLEPTKDEIRPYRILLKKE